MATETELHTALQRLSSGLRINGAADDAAGLAIAENLRADVAGLTQAVRNANDGLSVINVTDSALNEIGSLLHRAMTLAEQAASDTSGQDGSASKLAINAEYNQILTEIDRIASTVEFNGVQLLASSTSLDVQIGLSASPDDRITIETSQINTSILGLTVDALDDKASARTELSQIQSAIDSVSSDRGDLGAAYNRIEHTIAVITVQSENLMGAESQVRDADIAQEVVNMTRYQVLQQSGLSSLAQANASSQRILGLLQ